MKTLITLLVLILFNVPSLASTSADASSQDFSLNQESQQLSLEAKTFETVYRTDYVDSTCHRSETQGTRTECRTVYDHQCHTEYRQQCSYQSYPVCQSFPQNVCRPSQVCRTVMDSVCNSHGCTSVPRNVCQTTQQCSSQMQQVCRTEQRYECHNYPQNICQDVPRQACTTVPNIVQVAYSCQKPVQVAVGQNLKLHTTASVTVKFANYAEAGALSDLLTASLAGDRVKVTGTSKTHLYQIVNQSRSEVQVSPTERSLTLQITLAATPLQKLNEFSTLQLTDGKIGSDRIEFSISKLPEVPFKGHLLLERHRALASDLEILDRDFDSKLLVAQGNREILMLRALGVDSLKEKRHTAKISLTLDFSALKDGALNPEILNGVNALPVELEYEGRP